MFISPTPDPDGPPGGRAAEHVAAALRAAGDLTRLRALALLRHGEMAVGELAQALGQSQPRVSRHMRLLTDAGLVRRAREGAWVFYRLAGETDPERALADAAIGALDFNDPVIEADLDRLATVRAAREAAAGAYFDRVASEWSRIRALHMAEADIEAAMRAAAGPGPFPLMVDVGVGAGRMLAVFADRFERAIGLDTSREMLAVAGAELAPEVLARTELRRGDIFFPGLPARCADLVTVHHVLHYLADPGRAIAEAARLVKPGGVLLLADFAKHDREELRAEHAHRRLGFEEAEVAEWCRAAGAPVRAVRRLGPPAHVASGLTVLIWAAAPEAPAPQAEGALATTGADQ